MCCSFFLLAPFKFHQLIFSFVPHVLSSSSGVNRFFEFRLEGLQFLKTNNLKLNLCVAQNTVESAVGDAEIPYSMKPWKSRSGTAQSTFLTSNNNTLTSYVISSVVEHSGSDRKIISSNSVRSNRNFLFPSTLMLPTEIRKVYCRVQHKDLFSSPPRVPAVVSQPLSSHFSQPLNPPSVLPTDCPVLAWFSRAHFSWQILHQPWKKHQPNVQSTSLKRAPNPNVLIYKKASPW